MNPLRQIEAAELFINANNFSISYASAILAGTPQAQLVTPQAPKRLKGMTAEAIARMERELSRLDALALRSMKYVRGNWYRQRTFQQVHKCWSAFATDHQRNNVICEACVKS
jgi:hypothetical protein